MLKIPTVDCCGRKVSRLVCGVNPLSGFSHLSPELDREMIEFYTMPNIQQLLDECWRQGINAFQSRGDRHQMRAFLEHRLHGGRMQWIAQTASEFRDIKSNIAEIASYGPIAIYHHGTHTDNSWHEGRTHEVRDMEDHGWEADFYMCCFYNLARGYKPSPASDRDAYARDRFPRGDPLRMTDVIRKVAKPWIAFKILADG